MRQFALIIFCFSLVLASMIYLTKHRNYEKYIFDPKSSQQKIYAINLNLASANEFDNLPGLGPSLSQSIIQDRDHNGPFNSIEDLDRVKGIGPQKISKIRNYIE